MINKLNRDKVGVVINRDEENPERFTSFFDPAKGIGELTEKINEVIEAINKDNE